MPFILSGLVEHLGAAPRYRTVRFGFKYGRNFSMPLGGRQRRHCPYNSHYKTRVAVNMRNFFQPNEAGWGGFLEDLVLRFRHVYNIISIIRCQ